MGSTTSRLIVAAAFLLGVAGVALADIAPGDVCSAPGQPCRTAGPAFDQPGACVMTTCTRSVPGPDGGVTTMEYACSRCLPEGMGGAGKGGSGGAMGGAGGTAGQAGAAGAAGSTPAKHDSSGCSLSSAATPSTSFGALALVLGITFVSLRRRRGREEDSRARRR